MNSHSRLAVWLQEHFSFFKPEPLFKDLLRFLGGEIRKHAYHTAPGNLHLVVESKFGMVWYDKPRPVSKCAIEQVEFIPHKGKGFSFTVVDNELTIIRRNGSDPEYSPQISSKEMAEISVFMNQLRLKTEEFLKAVHR